jgi:L-fuculose-phosphate aldolase
MSDKKILKRLVATGKKADRCALLIGEGGNISARSGGVAYIKRRGASMGRARVTDYIPIDIKTGKPLRKNDKPSTEIYMHLACYRTRKDAGAVIHTHPVFATALGIADVDIKPLSYEMAVNLKSHIARISYVKAGTAELGKAVGRTLKRHNAILLKNHGLVTVGRDLQEAFLRTLAVERAALIYICCRILGRVIFMKKTDYLKFFQLS